MYFLKSKQQKVNNLSEPVLKISKAFLQNNVFILKLDYKIVKLITMIISKK